MAYEWRSPGRVSLKRLHELQQAMREAKHQPPCGTVEAYWWHRDRKQAIDDCCREANAEYERNRRRRHRHRPWNLNDLKVERDIVAARTRLQEAIHAKQAAGEWIA